MGHDRPGHRRGARHRARGQRTPQTPPLPGPRPLARGRRLGGALAAGALLALPVSCGSSSKGLIPSASAGPLESDVQAVKQAAERGDCSATEAALAKTERDFAALPSSLNGGLRDNLREGIETQHKVALELCAQPPAAASSATTSTTTTPPQTTPTTPTTPLTTTPRTVPTGPTTPPTNPTTTTPPGPGGGTVGPGEAPPGSEGNGSGGTGGGEGGR